MLPEAAKQIRYTSFHDITTHFLKLGAFLINVLTFRYLRTDFRRRMDSEVCLLTDPFAHFVCDSQYNIDIS